MVTINASLEAHRRIISQRHKMEEEGGKVVPTADALDVLLGVKEDE
jgi:hypothetical protein